MGVVPDPFAYRTRETAKNLKRESFEGTPEAELEQLTAKELALWHSKYSPEDPQYLYASYEWQRRITEKTIQAAITTAKQQTTAGTRNTLLSFVLGFITSVFLTIIQSLFLKQ